MAPLLGELRFLTPAAALVALAGLVPLVLLVLTERRGQRVRAPLGLAEAGILGRLEVPAAVFALSGLLGFAAAQPVLRTERPRLARRDAQAYIALDISRSMLASRSPRAPARIDRAKAIADELRARLADTPIGVATFTDRSLPLLFPSPNAAAFAQTVARAVGIDHPPPSGTEQTVTTFDALTAVPTEGYFRPGIAHRLLVVVTDGESAGFDADDARHSFATRPRVGVVVVKIGSPDEHVYGPDGLPEPGYFPPPASRRALAQFLAVTHGRAFGEHDIGGALRAARSALGTGPRARLGTMSARRDLAPYFVLAAALPLSLVLRRRNL
jgi:hypothetical protein